MRWGKMEVIRGRGERCGFRRERLKVGVWGSGFNVSGFGFRVSGFGFRVSGFGFRVSGARCRA